MYALCKSKFKTFAKKRLFRLQRTYQLTDSDTDKTTIGQYQSENVILGEALLSLSTHAFETRSGFRLMEAFHALLTVATDNWKRVLSCDLRSIFAYPY